MNFQAEVMKILNRHMELSQQQATALLILTERIADLESRIKTLENACHTQLAFEKVRR